MLTGKFIDILTLTKRKQRGNADSIFLNLPLIGNMSANEIKNHKESQKAINKHLNDLKEGKGITFDQLLNDLNITENNCSLFLLVFKCSNHVYKNESK